MGDQKDIKIPALELPEEDITAAEDAVSLELPETEPAAEEGPAALELSDEDPENIDDNVTLELTDEGSGDVDDNVTLELTDENPGDADDNVTLELSEEDSDAAGDNISLELPDEDPGSVTLELAEEDSVHAAETPSSEEAASPENGTDPATPPPADPVPPAEPPKEKKPRNLKRILIPVVLLAVIAAAVIAILMYVKAKDAPQAVVEEFLACAKKLDFDGMDDLLQSNDLTAFDGADVHNEAYHDYFVDLNKNMTYSVTSTNVDLNGETAQVTAHVRYLDNTGVYREALSDLLRLVVSTSQGDDSGIRERTTDQAASKKDSTEESEKGADKDAGDDADKASKDDADKTAKDDAAKTVKDDADKTAKDDAGKASKDDTDKASKDDTDKASKDDTDKASEDDTDKTSAEGPDEKTADEITTDADAETAELQEISATLTEEQIQEVILSLLTEKRDEADPVFTETDIVYPLIKADGKWKIVSLDSLTVRAMSANCVSIHDEVNRLTEKAPAAQVTNVDQGSTIDIENDRFSIHYTGSRLAKDFPGNPCLLLYYDYTNNGSVTSSALVDVRIQVFQHGNQCPAAIPEDNRSDTSTFTAEVRPGETLNICQAFSLEDTSDVTVQSSEAFAFGDGSIHSQVLSLSAVPE